MHKTVFIITVGICLTGCDKNASDKPVNELTQQEKTDLCSNPAIIKNIDGNFKAETIKNLSQVPMKYYPLLNAHEHDPEYLYKDIPYLYTAKIFEDGYGKSEHLKVSQTEATGSHEDSIRCQALLTFNSDSFYKTDISGPVSYRLIRQNGKYIPELPNVSLDSLTFYRRDQATEGQTKWRLNFFETLAAGDEKVKTLANDTFVPVSQDDLTYIFFAQALRKFSDDEIMSFFSPNWANTTDTFAKEDFKKEELPKIKAKITQYKDMHNLIMYASSDYGYNKNPGISDLKTTAGEKVFNISGAGIPALIGESYDFNLKGYKYYGLECTPNSISSYHYRGISFSITRRLNTCVLKIPDDKARQVSALLSSLNSEHKDLEYFDKYYLHIDKIDGNTNDISASIVREELKIYEPDNHELVTEALLN